MNKILFLFLTFACSFAMADFTPVNSDIVEPDIQLPLTNRSVEVYYKNTGLQKDSLKSLSFSKPFVSSLNRCVNIRPGASCLVVLTLDSNLKGEVMPGKNIH